MFLWMNRERSRYLDLEGICLRLRIIFFLKKKLLLLFLMNKRAFYY
jgi:hypothetical protein